MTNLLRPFALTALTCTSLIMPLSSAAYGGNMSYDPSDTGGIIQTPLRIRGQYLWITPLSHRQQRVQMLEERRAERRAERMERPTLLMRPASRLELL